MFSCLQHIKQCHDTRCYFGTMSVFSVISLIFVLCVVGLTITSAKELDILDPDFKCLPGETFEYKCNTCSCSEDGSVGYCTYKLCPSDNGLIPPSHPDFKCTPGELFRHGCYDCRCYDGKNAFCNFAFCNTRNNDQHFCEDGESKKNQCNLCKCINKEWACTKKFCVPEVDIFENKDCENGAILRRGCNLCRCLPEIGYACDKEECPPDQPADIIEDRNCKVGTEYNVSCNVCKCIPGLGYACDREDCPEAVYVA